MARVFNAMKVIALITQKGGCGKTALATSLAVTALDGGHKVLIVDTDSQRTASAWWESRDADVPHLVEVTGDQIAPAVETARDKGFDFVFIDTPARAEPVNAAAAQAAHFCILPCRPSMADMRAQAPTVATARRLAKPAAFVLNCCPPRGSRIREAERGLAIYGLPVAPQRVVERVAFSDAYGLGLGVTEFDPNGLAASEIRELWEWMNKKMEKLSHAA